MAGDETQAAVEVFVMLLAGATLVALLTRRVTLLPYSVALVVAGLAIAALGLPLEIRIDPDLLLSVLIPGLVFEAAYRIDLRQLWPNLAAVVALGTVGVLITAAAVALALVLVADVALPLAFLVGTILAATDPVAVIAVMGRLNVPPRLATLVEAESLFNDGTGIVVFGIALEAMRRHVAAGELLIGLAVAVVASIALGAAIGYLTSRILARVDDHLLELTLSVVAAYGSYLLAERLGQSAILATVACGLVFGSAGRRAGSATTEDAIDTVWEFIAFLLTTLVFLLIGLAISLPQLARAAVPIAAALAALFVARGLVVYGMLGGGSRLGERLGWGRALPGAWLHLIAWAGLRGAIAVALALSLPADLPQRDLVQGIVFGCVLISILVQGTTSEPLVRRLGIATRGA